LRLADITGQYFELLSKRGFTWEVLFFSSWIFLLEGKSFTSG